MNTRLFLAICLLFALFTAKGQPQITADLKLGDWLELEYIVFLRDSTPGDIWRAEDVFKIRFRGTVIRKTKEDLTLSFKPVHYFYNRYDEDEVVYSPMPGSKIVLPKYRKIYYLSNSYMKDYYEHNTIFPKGFDKDSLMLTFQLPEGSIQDSLYCLSSDFILFNTMMYSLGLKNNDNLSGINTMGGIDSKASFHNAVVGYFSQWYASGKGMPETVFPNHIQGFSYMEHKIFVPHTSPIVRLVDASFDKNPNLVLVYKTDFPQQEPLSITVKGKKYTFEQKDKDLMECRFFLSSPSKAVFDGTNMLLTPGDSIYFEKDESGTCIFSGKGAENCMYAQEEQKLLRMYRPDYDEKLKKRIEKMTAIYSSLWNKYQDNMSDYWLKSSQLSYKYKYIVMCLGNVTELNWDDTHFVTAAPYIDYLYQPDNYNEFTDAVFWHQIQKLQDNNMTVRNIFSNNMDKYQYYVQSSLFSGYPRLLLMKNTLTKIMQKNHYSKYRPEYDVFMQTCFEPELRREISELHRQLMQIEPGRKIQDINPEFAKLPFLKNKADGYIMFNCKYQGSEWDYRGLNWDLRWVKGFWHWIKNKELTEPVELIMMRTKEYIESLPDSLKNPNRYFYLADVNEMKYIEDFLGFFNGDFLLLRTDGTIVSREFSTTGDTYFVSDVIRADIAERDRKPEKSRKALLHVILISCIVLLIVAFVSGIYFKIVKLR